MGGLRWGGTTSASPIQHQYATHQGHSNNQGNLGVQQCLEVLLWQNGNHMEEVDLTVWKE